MKTKNPLSTLYLNYVETCKDSDELNRVYDLLSKVCVPHEAFDLLGEATLKEAEDAFYAGFRTAVQIFMGGVSE